MNTFDLNTLPVLQVAPNRYVRVTGLGWVESKPVTMPTVKFCHLHGADQDKEHELELEAFLSVYTGAVAIQPTFARGQVYLIPGSSEAPERRVEIVAIVPDEEPEMMLSLRDHDTGTVFFADATEFQKQNYLLVQIH